MDPGMSSNDASTPRVPRRDYVLILLALAMGGFAIGISERDQWMACMRQAMVELDIEPGMAERLGKALAGTADWMRNKGG